MMIQFPSTAPPWSVVRADSFRLMMGLATVLFIVALDVSDFFGGRAYEEWAPARYLILAVPAAWAFVIRVLQPSTLVRRLTRADRVLLLLAGVGVVGSIYGKLYLGTVSSALPMLAPAFVVFLYPFAGAPLNEFEARRMIKWLAAIGVLYVFLHSLASLQYLGLTNTLGYSHEKAFLIVLAVGAAFLSRSWLKLAVLGVLVGFIFVQYPAGTYPIVGLGALATWLLTRPRASKMGIAALWITIVAVLVISFLALDQSVSTAEDYFRFVGKQSNVTTRLELWEIGFEKIGESPWLGSVFAGEMSVSTILSGEPAVIPLHNDFLLIAAGGGLVALGLFILWIVLTNVMVIRRVRALAILGARERVRLNRALLMGFNAWMLNALFNPLLQSLATSACLFVIYGMMMVAGLYPIRSDRDVNSKAFEASNRLSSSVPYPEWHQNPRSHLG